HITSAQSASSMRSILEAHQNLSILPILPLTPILSFLMLPNEGVSHIGRAASTSQHLDAHSQKEEMDHVQCCVGNDVVSGRIGSGLALALRLQLRLLLLRRLCRLLRLRL